VNEKNDDMSPELLKRFAAALTKHGARTVGDLTEDQVREVVFRYHEELASEAVNAVAADESSALKDIVERASEPGLLLALAIVTAHDRGIDDAMARARGDTEVSPRWS
jgi:hypothetical protein